MEELVKGSEPSGPGKTGIFSPLSRPLRAGNAPRDINAWYKATFWASLACILLYTLFGLVFVRAHALRIASEMGLMVRFAMTPLITPDDPLLHGLSHQLAAALFFGMTLGTLNAMVCMVFTFPAWLWGRLTRFDLVAVAASALVCTYFSFSLDMPWVSICFGMVCPVLFIAVWLLSIRGKGCRQPSFKRWGAFCVVILLPLVIIALTSPSFLAIRDSMLALRITEPLSDIYYEHTLLAADVIKPVSARSQNVIAISGEITDLGHTPHGTLWIRSDNPCAVKGAAFVADTSERPCRSILLPADGLAANHGNRIMQKYAKTLDPNRYMRNGIGFFFFSGPLVFITALILSWIALALERVFMWNKAVSILLVMGYLSTFIPAFHGAYLLARIKTHPDMIPRYAASTLERERYTVVAMYPGALSKEDLLRLMQDPSARVRLNALMEAGYRRDESMVGTIAVGLKDPKLNVRTKACWALGKIPTHEAARLLDRVVVEDPSWYVRDYAYASLGSVRPQTKVVDAW